MTVRHVPLTSEQVQTIEDLGLELVRANDPRASMLLAIVLQWRGFACDVDESAGLAEVTELNVFSRRVGA